MAGKKSGRRPKRAPEGVAGGVEIAFRIERQPADERGKRRVVRLAGDVLLGLVEASRARVRDRRIHPLGGRRGRRILPHAIEEETDNRRIEHGLLVERGKIGRDRGPRRRTASRRARRRRRRVRRGAQDGERPHHPADRSSVGEDDGAGDVVARRQQRDRHAPLRDAPGAFRIVLDASVARFERPAVLVGRDLEPDASSSRAGPAPRSTARRTRRCCRSRVLASRPAGTWIPAISGARRSSDLRISPVRQSPERP